MRTSSHSGFSLIETVVALAILAIAATVALPEFTGMVANRRVASAADDLFATLVYARSEAIRENRAVKVTPYDNGEWSDGWQVEDPANAGTFFLKHANTKLNVTSSAAGEVTYFPSGRIPAGSVTTFTLCDTNARARQRLVSIDLDGLPVIKKGDPCQ